MSTQHFQLILDALEVGLDIADSFEDHPDVVLDKPHILVGLQPPSMVRAIVVIEGSPYEVYIKAVEPGEAHEPGGQPVIKSAVPMSPVKAATRMIAQLNPELLGVAERHHHGDGSRHMAFMLKEIVRGDMSIGKQNRWLGWAQCLAMIYNHFTLDQIKRINKES